MHIIFFPQKSNKKKDDLTKTTNRLGGQVVFVFCFCFLGGKILRAFIPHIFKTFAIIYWVIDLYVRGARAVHIHAHRHTYRIAYYSLAPASGPG